MLFFLFFRNEEVRKSLDVLDRVLSEFDDIETDTGDEAGIIEVNEVKKKSDKPSKSQNGQNKKENKEQDKSNSGPPPVDRTLKPQIAPALPQKSRPKSALQQNTNDSEAEGGSSQNSSDNSHEYQEINSDLMNTIQSDRSGKKKQTSIERNRRREELRIKRQISRDLQCSSSDITTLEGPHKSKQNKEELRSRDPLPSTERSRDIARDGRHLRKSRSGEVNLERKEGEDFSRKSGKSRGPRRSRSSDRLLDPRDYPPNRNYDHKIDPRLIDPRMFDPRLIDPRLMDPQIIDPQIIDPQMIDSQIMDPRLHDPHLMDPVFPMEDGIRFPHLLGYPSMPPANHMGPPENPPGIHSLPHGPPGIPPDFPGYPMFPYDYPFLPEHMMPGDQLPVYDPIIIPPHPGMIPPEYRHMDIPPDFPMGYPLEIPPDYPIDYPIDYDPYPPEVMHWNMHGRGRGEDPWMTPTPEEAEMLIRRGLR